MPFLIGYPSLSMPGVYAVSTARDDCRLYSYYTSENDADRELAAKSRLELLRASGFGSLVTLGQVHPDSIFVIDSGNLKTFLDNPLIEGDGLITLESNVLLGITTADCVPLFYTDREGSFCSIIHAGWKGIGRKIHIKALEKIKETAGKHPEHLIIAAGPHIKSCCYEVGKEMTGRIDHGRFYHTGEKYYFDLYETIKKDMLSAGVRPENISCSPYCSLCSENPAFYSYRGGEKRGGPFRS